MSDGDIPDESLPAAAKEPKNSFDKLLDTAKAPLATFGVFVAAITGAATNWTKIVDLFHSNAVLVTIIGFCVGSGIAWGAVRALPLPPQGRLIIVIRAAAIVILGALSVALLSLEPTCLFGCSRATWTPIRSGALFLVSRAEAADGDKLRVVDYIVDETRSTFRLTNDDQSIHGTLDNKIRPGLEFDRSMYEVFESATCRGMDGEQPIEDALPVWRSLLEKRNQAALVSRLSDYTGYKWLIQHGGSEAFNAARPNQAELVDLKATKPAWYELIMRWMVECVGVADPVVVWTISNDSSRALTLSSVDYDVLDVSQVAGGGPETIEPIDIAPHDLAHVKGIQTRQIMPRIKIPPGERAAFRVKYRMEASAPGYTWLVQPTFRTLEGVSAVGPELKIFNAKH